jgi:hypothetical protein
VNNKKTLNFIEQFLRGVTHTLNYKSIAQGFERKILVEFYKWKRNLFRSAIELSLFLVGGLFVLLGLVLLVSEYIALKYVLIIVGVIILYAALLMTKLR